MFETVPRSNTCLSEEDGEDEENIKGHAYKDRVLRLLGDSLVTIPAQLLVKMVNVFQVHGAFDGWEFTFRSTGNIAECDTA